MGAMSPSNAPLVSKSIQLYDPDCLMVMDRQVAKGFVTILGGSSTPEQPLSRGAGKAGKDAGAIADPSLAFLALTEGNTIDACFGVSSISSKDARGKMYAKEVKSMLLAASDSNDDIRRKAVLTYLEAFRIAIRFHDKASNLNFFTRCFCYGKLQKKCVKELKENFEYLDEAIQATL